MIFVKTQKSFFHYFEITKNFTKVSLRTYKEMIEKEKFTSCRTDFVLMIVWFSFVKSHWPNFLYNVKFFIETCMVSFQKPHYYLFFGKLPTPFGVSKNLWTICLSHRVWSPVAHSLSFTSPKVLSLES